MRRSLSILILLAVLAVFASPALAEGPTLTGAMDARKIVLDENNQEIAVPADKVYPRDLVEYTLRYSNSGNASATGVNLVGPIPEGTIYLDQTATDDALLHPLFSIDQGETYHEAPVTYIEIDENGQEVTKTATPDMITHIKWMMGNVMEVGQEVSVSYRVQVM